MRTPELGDRTDRTATSGARRHGFSRNRTTPTTDRRPNRPQPPVAKPPAAAPVRTHRKPIITVEASQRRAKRLYPQTHRIHHPPVLHPCVWPGWYHRPWYGWGGGSWVVWGNDCNDPEVIYVESDPIVIEREVLVPVEPVEEPAPLPPEEEPAPESAEPEEDLPALDPETERWLTEGSQAFVEKRYADAAEAFRMAMVKSPVAAAPRFAFGQALLAMGDWDYAANVLRSALTQDPGILEATGSIAGVYESAEEFYVVLSRLKTQVAKTPEDPDVLFLLVYQYYFSDDPSSVPWFTRLSKASPKDASLKLLRPALRKRFPEIR